jgi:AraC family transcriptional regulator, regulatory protein of adaptative response / DNA-3-methyladenine glycosylase II
MEAFSAVATTGIYCRPECSAKPLPQHVTKYRLAAAAEAAGYRACLRCRPYRSPDALDWSGPELVCRAVQLILGGALDGGTEAALGARLGVSARHLRRLFSAHLGVTPDGLARSARAHFARRLLDETDLSVSEVAFAAGFGSVRQFNRACRDVFRLPPRELRARRRKNDRLAAEEGLTLRLPFDGALDWCSLLGYFEARAIPGVETVSGEAYRRTIVAGGEPGFLELMPGGDEDHLLLRVHLAHWDELMHVVSRARRIAGLDADQEAAATQLGADLVVGPLLRKRPGLRVPGTWDPYETGVRAILGQQVSVTGANTLAGRLVERLGLPVPFDRFGLSRLFPPPAALAEADLAELGLTTARAAAVRSFARAVAEDAIRLDRSVGLERLVESIQAIDGLGPWTAHYIALRLGERDAWPASDLGLRRALGQHPREVAERWRPWRALAATHLWLADSGERRAA